MGKNLRVRELKRKNLPYGRFNWIIKINREAANISLQTTNSSDHQNLRKILQNAGSYGSRFTYSKNWCGRKVWDQLYLVNSSDVFLLKLCYPNLIHKIYKIAKS
jgi:hypothetical protein